VSLGWLAAGIVGSNPTKGMDDCSRLSMLCCLVYEDALRQLDHSSKEYLKYVEIAQEASYRWAAKVLQ
jgi:hypothetical protein